MINLTNQSIQIACQSYLKKLKSKDSSDSGDDDLVQLAQEYSTLVTTAKHKTKFTQFFQKLFNNSVVIPKLVDQITCLVPLTSDQSRPKRLCSSIIIMTFFPQLASFIDNNPDQTNTLLQTLDSLFDSIIVHRYRDIDPQIRCLAVNSLANAILAYPSHLLHSKYINL
jgi:hypothetical protein